jgi:asparagine synthase (glutamine-hydrolysing)
MCGIAGILYADAAEAPSKPLITKMTDALAHRGPDGQGFHIEAGLALGHRRLAIIDPAGGQQPMYNEDHSIAIVFNGEIFNFETLRQELSALGHVFRNRCDTEAIIHAWESFGPDCVDRLSGQFAFALWDGNRRILFCARDRMGEKPFHYTWLPRAAGRDFAFASELRALAVLPGLERRLSATATEDFFAFGYVPEPATIFEGVHKLPAAHTLTIAQNGAPVLRRYWSPPSQVTACGEDDALTAMRAHLTRAVGAQLVADVPLGAFLSGGVDSSAVVAAASGLRAEKLDTFTIGFEGAEDETPYARIVAARYGTRQHEDRAQAVDMIDAARSQAAMFGEPFGDGLPAGAAACHCGDFRRWRGRGAGRLPPHALAHAGQRRAPLRAARGTAPCDRAAGSALSQAGPRAAFPARKTYADRIEPGRCRWFRPYFDQAARGPTAQAVFRLAPAAARRA